MKIKNAVRRIVQKITLDPFDVDLKECGFEVNQISGNQYEFSIYLINRELLGLHLGDSFSVEITEEDFWIYECVIDCIEVNQDWCVKASGSCMRKLKGE